MVSGYLSQLYGELLCGWQNVELQVMNEPDVRTEKLWSNFTVDRVHWARYMDKDFTDRQRIKRKAETWGRRYQESLPSLRDVDGPANVPPVSGPGPAGADP